MPVNPLDKIREALEARRGEPAASPASSAARRLAAGRPGDAYAARRRRKRQPLLARIVNDWWTRLLQSVYKGSLGEQEAEYESHSTSRDYVWNTLGTTVWGMSLPILSIVATQLAGTEQAGMFSMAFSTGMPTPFSTSATSDADACAPMSVTRLSARPTPVPQAAQAAPTSNCAPLYAA